MLNWWGDRHYRRLLLRHTTTKLTREALTKYHAKEVISAISKSSLVKHKLLEECSNKIEYNSRLTHKLMLWSSIALGIIFANIIGVELELSLLGFKLSDANKLKELIFLGTIVSGYIGDYLIEETKLLKQLEYAIAEKTTGKPVADLTTKLKQRLEVNFYEFTWLESKNYSIPYYKFWQTVFPTIIDFILLSLSLFVSLAFIHIVIAIDIWQNSNLPSPWNQILVFAFALTIINSVVKALRSARPTSVTVKSKREDFSKRIDDPESRKQMIEEYLKTK